MPENDLAKRIFVKSFRDNSEGRKKMKCEICGKDLGDRVYITFLVDDGTVLLTCPRCEPPRSYDIALKRFLEDPVNWIAHLSEKRWFNSDKFNQSMRRIENLSKTLRGHTTGASEGRLNF
jgi:hypothetical protein